MPLTDMRRIAINLTILGALLCGAFSLGAQGTPADTVLQRAVRKQLDSLARDRTAPLYSKRAQARIDSLLVNHLVGIVPVPVPPDTTPPPQPACVAAPVDSSLGVAALPRVYLATCYPTAARRYVIGANVQQALDTAKAGDELVLTAGTTYTGNFTWVRCLSGPVVLTGPSGPAEGVRVTPALAAAFGYPKLISPNTTPVLLARSGSCGLRVSRVEITHAPIAGSTVNYNYGLVRIGEGELSVDLQPRDIVLDRVYIHGTDATFIQNAVIVNGRSLALVDSWVDHVRWKGVESHCVIGWAGAGPFKITNNHLDCAGIGVLFGGARRAIAGVAPADIEVRGNHFVKDSSYIGYVAKNAFELKDASRVLFEGNVLERSYFGAQTGGLMVLQSLSDEGDTTVQVSDVVIRWNRLRLATQCFMASARGYNGVARPLSRVEITNNLCTEVGDDSLSRVATMSGDIRNLTMVHNTFARNETPIKQQGVIADTGPAQGTVFKDNVFGSGQLYGCVFRSGGATGMAAWQAFDPGAVVAGNVCWSNKGAKTPLTDFFAATLADVGFNPDWSLAATSAYKGKATDGKDPGADVAELARRLAGVVVLP